MSSSSSLTTSSASFTLSGRDVQKIISGLVIALVLFVPMFVFG